MPAYERSVVFEDAILDVVVGKVTIGLPWLRWLRTPPCVTHPSMYCTLCRTPSPSPPLPSFSQSSVLARVCAVRAYEAWLASDQRKEDQGAALEASAAIVLPAIKRLVDEAALKSARFRDMFEEPNAYVGCLCQPALVI